MPCLVVLDGLKHGEVRPATRGRRPTRLQHGSHGLADLAELFGVGTYDVAAHDGGGSLSQEASLDRLPERRHAIAFALRSTVTVEPQSLEWAVAVASASANL